jgi:ketosteroid isomerase-like protein
VEWDGFEVEVLELIDAGDDRVVSVIRERGKLKDSEAWVEHTRGAVWTVSERRITRYEEHQDREQALAAVGKPEPDALPEQVRSDRQPSDSGDPGLGPITES